MDCLWERLLISLRACSTGCLRTAKKRQRKQEHNASPKTNAQLTLLVVNPWIEFYSGNTVISTEQTRKAASPSEQHLGERVNGLFNHIVNAVKLSHRRAIRRKHIDYIS